MKYKDTSPILRNTVTNGCGAKGGWLNPPEFFFTASCDEHDWNYWVGGDEAARKKADEGFYKAMRDDIAMYLLVAATPFQTFSAKVKYPAAAWLYYKAVRMFGKSHFHYGTPRAEEDLWDEAMAVHRVSPNPSLYDAVMDLGHKLWG